MKMSCQNNSIKNRFYELLRETLILDFDVKTLSLLQTDRIVHLLDRIKFIRTNVNELWNESKHQQQSSIIMSIIQLSAKIESIIIKMETFRDYKQQQKSFIINHHDNNNNNNNSLVKFRSQSDSTMTTTTITLLDIERPIIFQDDNEDILEANASTNPCNENSNNINNNYNDNYNNDDDDDEIIIINNKNNNENNNSDINDINNNNNNNNDIKDNNSIIQSDISGSVYYSTNSEMDDDDDDNSCTISSTPLHSRNNSRRNNSTMININDDNENERDYEVTSFYNSYHTFSTITINDNDNDDDDTIKQQSDSGHQTILKVSDDNDNKNLKLNTDQKQTNNVINDSSKTLINHNNNDGDDDGNDSIAELIQSILSSSKSAADVLFCNKQNQLINQKRVANILLNKILDKCIKCDEIFQSESLNKIEFYAKKIVDYHSSLVNNKLMKEFKYSLLNEMEHCYCLQYQEYDNKDFNQTLNSSISMKDQQRMIEKKRYLSNLYLINELYRLNFITADYLMKCLDFLIIRNEQIHFKQLINLDFINCTKLFVKNVKPIVEQLSVDATKIAGQYRMICKHLNKILKYRPSSSQSMIMLSNNKSPSSSSLSSSLTSTTTTAVQPQKFAMKISKLFDTINTSTSNNKGFKNKKIKNQSFG